jgi:hypothetical protein
MKQHQYQHILEDNLQYNADMKGLADNFIFEQDFVALILRPRFETITKKTT